VKFITLTNANHKVPVQVAVAHIAAIYSSPSDRTTHIISVGAIVPVLEPVDEVIRLIRAQDGPKEK
jgi:hypothetical protein